MIKLELINNKDIENIKMENECYKNINNKVNIYKVKVSDEILSEVELKGFNKISMEKSQIKLYKLNRKYRSTTDWFMSFSLGSMFTILSLLTINHPPNQYKLLSALMGLLGVVLLYDSIKNYIIRRKIKENLKNYNLL